MNPSDIRQSREFASFMAGLNWQTEKISGSHVYLRKFPIIGSFAKCPRPDKIPDPEEIRKFIRDNKIYRFNIAPNIEISDKNYIEEKRNLLKNGFLADISPFNPTTTITVNLDRSEDEIFRSFSEAKRRAVRRAKKFGIRVEITDDIDSFVKIRQKQFAPLGFLVTREMSSLWNNFYPAKADLLLAVTSNGGKVAGILLLYHKKKAYYWFASALGTGKKQFAPTLLVWEAVKQAKKRGCYLLDFEGIYDERFPKASETWRGFTRFKEGFSEDKTVLMENFYLKRTIISL